MGPDVWRDADADAINALLQLYIATSLTDSASKEPPGPPTDDTTPCPRPDASCPCPDDSSIDSVSTQYESPPDDSESDSPSDTSSGSESGSQRSTTSTMPGDPVTERKRKRYHRKNHHRRQRRLEIRQLHAQEIAYLQTVLAIDAHTYDPSQFPMNEQLVQELSIAEATVSAAALPHEIDIDMDAQVPFDNEALCFFPVKLSCPPAHELRLLLKQAAEDKRFPAGQDVLSTLLSTADSHLPPSAVPPRLVPTQVFADSGASCSVIHADIVKKLNLLTIRSTHGIRLVDVNKRLTEHHTLAYVQLSFPDISYRQILLCVVMEHTPHQFLLGSKDQKELGIHANLSTRQVSLGPSDAPCAIIPMTRLRSHPPVSLPVITRTYHGPKVSSYAYPDEIPQSIACLKAQMPSLSCLYNSLTDDGSLQSSTAVSDTMDHDPEDDSSPPSMPFQVYSAFLASMETHEPEFVDLTKIQLPPDPVKRTPLTDQNDGEEPSLPTGLPPGVPPPLNPKAQRLSDKFDWLYTEVLKEVQQNEQAVGATVSERDTELDEDTARILQEQCTQELADARPPEFPPELWKYVCDQQKPLIKDRFAKYPDANRAKLVKDIVENLDIYALPVATDLFRAQALANLDAFGHPNPDNPPTIPGYEYKIELTDPNPVYHKPQRFNQTETAFLEARITELKGYGKLEDSDSQYNTQLCLVPYHDRITKDIADWGANAVTEMFKPENHARVATWYRLTNNFKPINAITKKYHFPMPDMADVLHHTRGSRYWSITDIKDAFFTVHMEEASREYTTFTTPGGRYKFTVMPMGAQNSPMFWSRIATETFSHIPKSKLINFVDDNTNHAKRFYTHYQTQQEMYDAMREKKMVCKVSKSHFLYPSAKILGHIMSEYGRTTDPEKVKPIMEMIPPRNIAELRSILGLINVNKDYLPMNKNYLGPLEELLKKDADVVKDWRPEYHGKAFQEMKLALTSAPCLLTLDITKPFVLHVDACRIGRGIGAVLLQQNHKGDWRPVAYYSYRLTEGERTRCATELEAMALVYAIKYWSPYLRVQEFTAIVDHHALIYLVSQPAKTSNVRILNWISELHAYRFNIHHRAGKKHLDADAVSRLLQYRDLEDHDALNTVDLDVPDISGPATAEDILRLHKLIGAYQDQVMGLKDELEAMRQENLNRSYANIRTTVDKKTSDYKERLNLLRKMSSHEEGDYWRLITSREYQDMLGRQQGIVPTADGSNERNHHLAEVEDEYASDQESQVESHVSATSQASANQDDKPPSEPPVVQPTSYRYNTRSRGPIMANAGNIIDDDKAPTIPRALLRQNVIPPPPRRKQYIAKHTRPLDVPTLVNRDAPIDTEHQQVKQYKHLEWRVFQDPITTRLYRIVLVYYDHEYNCPAAYRKVLDDMPPHPFDSFPWRIEGPDGVKSLVEKYESNHFESVVAPIVPWPKTELEMLALQETDPNWQPIAKRLLTQDADDHFEYTPTRHIYIPTQRDGSKGAMRLYDPRYEKDPDTDRILLPNALVYTLLQLYHDQNGHSGIHRAIDTIKLKYWWPSYRDDVTTYVQSCQFCRWSKANTLAAPIPSQAYNAPSRPWEVVHIDLMGPFPKTLHGNQYVLTAKCALTGAIELAPLPDKKPLPVARELIDRVYLRHGSPRLLFSDQGLEFLNKVVAHVSALFQIKHVPTTAGNPQANGLVEAHNKESKRQLTAFTNARQNDWDTFLAVIQFAYMTTVSTRTGYTPFFLIHGREASQPHETWIGAFAKVPSLPEHVKKLIECLQEAWRYAGETKVKQVDKMNKVPVQRPKFVEYEVGDRFYLGQHPVTQYQDYSDPKRTKHRIAFKLQFRWVGPYTITRKFSPVLYEAAINGELRAVHALQMKPDPTSKYYNLHRKVFRAQEPRKEPVYEAKLNSTGKPKIHIRLHKKLLSPETRAAKAHAKSSKNNTKSTKGNDQATETSHNSSIDSSSDTSSDDSSNDHNDDNDNSSEDLDADL